MVGRQTPFLALIVPLILVGMVDGLRGIRAVVAGRDGRRPRVRDRPVRVLELRLGRAHRHRRLAARRPARSSRFLRVWQPSEPLRDGRRASARPGDRRRRGGRRRARGRGAAARGRRRRDSRGDIIARLRAVPDHHRRLRARPVGPDQGLRSTGATQEFALARPGRPQRQGRGADVVTFKFNWLPRGRHAAARLRPADDARRCASRPVARCASTAATLNQLKWATLTVAAVLALAYVMNLSRADAHARQLDRRRRRRARASSRRSSAGSASR